VSAKIRRRALIALLSGVTAWPLATRAQQPAGVRRIAVLMGTDENDPVSQSRLEVFRNTLAALGWSEGRNVRYEIRWSAGIRLGCAHRRASSSSSHRMSS
jgi:putative ABC transport system substrate-binding protein